MSESGPEETYDDGSEFARYDATYSVDQAIIARYSSIATKKVKERLAPLIRRYRSACALACGPDERRAAYWQAKSRLLARRLREKLKLPDPELKPLEAMLCPHPICTEWQDRLNRWRAELSSLE